MGGSEQKELSASPTQFNLSNLLNLRTLVNPDVLKLATLLASSSSNQGNQQLYFNNPITGVIQNPNQQIRNCASTPSSLPSTPLSNNSNLMGAKDGQYLTELLENMNYQSSQENLIPSCLTDNSVALPSNQPSNIGNKIPTSQNFNYDSILSIPMSSTSTTHVNSSSTFINSSSSEDERGSHCSNMFKFEIPESLEMM
ncbi:hypothetical protein Ccrd_001999 [Cynara cardunculus var. scolymus]|uniref:Uncharacterized protein n=1 Tax=Cynara cardunculus var. scolymus TaxID=59895 RepID=A0A103XS95_CYNCS|nr:hypothetical protein Ccrd_001999 [Cynara cardunculus var. scolymus]